MSNVRSSRFDRCVSLTVSHLNMEKRFMQNAQVVDIFMGESI